MVQHVEDVAAASLEGSWQALLKDSNQGSPFLTWAWHQAMVSCYGQRLRPVLITAWDGPRLIALASLARTSEWWGFKRYRWLGCGPNPYSMADSQDILVAEGYEATGVEQVFADLSQSLGRWDIVDLKEVPRDSPTLRMLLAEARRKGWKALVEPMGPRHVISLPLSWEEYLAQLSKNMKSSLERKTRKLAREHDIQFSAACSASEVDAYMGHLERLHTARWRERGCPGIFAVEGAQAFHRHLAHEFFRQGMLDLIALWVDGEPAAVSYNFRLGKTLYNYASGFDTREDLVKYSPGMVLNGFMIQRAIRKGCSEIDLLRGDQHYKEHYAAVPRQNVRVLVFKTRHAYFGYLLAKQARRWLKPIKARVRSRGLIG